LTSLSPSVDPSSADDTAPRAATSSEPALGRHGKPRRQPLASVLRQLPLIVLPLIWLAMAWQRRWIADDGMIEARVVRQILAGHGPVFNIGERVEANTPTLWTWLLALVTWVSHVDVYRVMIGLGLVLAPAGLLLALLGTRNLQRRTAPGRLYVPLGAAVIVALPPFWDFATSGLEDAVTFCWLGLTWWLFTGLSRDSRSRAVWSALVVGLGWLVRPDMAIVTAFFLVALWFIVRPSWPRTVALVAIAGVTPLAYQVFRMGYYGLLVPNTAVAKSASSLNWAQGWAYVEDFTKPYYLWLPLVLLLILLPLTMSWRQLDSAARAVCIAALASAVSMTLYVVAIGGDFMHARMLLPATFTLLLPVMTVPIPRPSPATIRTAMPAGLLAVALAVWAVFCGVSWRDPGGIPASGIANERAWYVGVTGQSNPDRPEDYEFALYGRPAQKGSPNWEIAQALTSGQPPQLLYSPPGQNTTSAVPLNKLNYSIATPGVVLGTLGALLPLNGLAIDVHGLAYSLGGHLQPVPGARVGHAKSAGLAWIIAEYSNATSAPGVPAGDIAAARKALGCGELAKLIKATTAPLTFHQFLTNIVDSPGLTHLSIPNDPHQAVAQLCR
jgi:arabinofuranosyltransferase